MEGRHALSKDPFPILGQHLKPTRVGFMVHGFLWTLDMSNSHEGAETPTLAF
jgi:hypothetical protein